MHVHANAHRVTAGVLVTPELNRRVARKADAVVGRQVHIDAGKHLIPGRVEVDAQDVVVLGDLVDTAIPVFAFEQLLVLGDVQPAAVGEFNQ
ncbi:hypothetical protein D3C79_931720 [compost metagenome]